MDMDDASMLIDDIRQVYWDAQEVPDDKSVLIEKLIDEVTSII